MSYPLTALISDLHGNLPALETALADARERGAKRYVCLGDVVGYGASPKPCLDLVMDLCPKTSGLCLLGNHEHALLHSAEDFNPKARSAIEWTRESLNDPADRDASYRYWDFLDSLSPLERDDRAMFAHGSPRDPVREYLLPRDARNREKMEENFRRMDREVCFVGHSHVPAIYFEDGRLFRPRDGQTQQDLETGPGARAIVNVGSVGQPRDGDPRLSYALFDGNTVLFRRLEYDIEAAAAAIRAIPELPEFLAERLAIGR